MRLIADKIFQVVNLAVSVPESHEIVESLELVGVNYGSLFHSGSSRRWPNHRIEKSVNEYVQAAQRHLSLFIMYTFVTPHFG